MPRGKDTPAQQRLLRALTTDAPNGRRAAGHSNFGAPRGGRPISGGPPRDSNQGIKVHAAM
eukprot:5244569-Alexandrium_andersonii.AAC.1